MGATIVKMDKNVSKIFDIKIRPYSDDDMLVLEKTLGDPSQMIHLNGPENHERLERRHEEYVRMSIDPIAGCMYTITVHSGSVPVGHTGYWETEWNGEKGWETGWFVIPEFQGKGIATAAMRILIDQLATLNIDSVFAYPSVTNEASNAISKKLGFTVIEEMDYEYPRESGKLLRCNVWKLDLIKYRENKAVQ